MKLQLVIILCSFLSAFKLNGQNLENLKNEVEKIIEFDYDLNLDEGEGIWIGVIDSDSTFIFKIGNIAGDSLSEFQLGSLSKIFTYRSLENLLDNNEIDIDSKVTDYLDLNSAYQNISFKDLGDHKSLLPKEPYFFGKRSINPDNPYESYPEALIVPELNKYSNLYPGGNEKEFGYGHLNYAILALAMESISEENYCSIIKADYGSAFPSVMCSDLSKNLIWGLDKAGLPILPWSFPSFAASEGLSANIIDFTNFIRTELLRPDDVSEISKISKHLAFQAPWYILNLKRSQKTYSFSGTTSAHSNFVCFDKNSQTAVVMMRNSGKGILHLPLTILDMVRSRKAKSK